MKTGFLRKGKSCIAIVLALLTVISSLAVLPMTSDAKIKESTATIDRTKFMTALSDDAVSFQPYRNNFYEATIDRDIFMSKFPTTAVSFAKYDGELTANDLAGKIRIDDKTTGCRIYMWNSGSNNWVWWSDADEDKVYLPINSAKLFSAKTNLTTVDLNTLNASRTTSFYILFYNDAKLKTAKVDKLDTSNVTNMQGVFCDCSALTSLDLTNWNTSKVTSMWQMFNRCTSLTGIGSVENWDTSKVTDMRTMFQNCSKLKQLDVSNWDTSNVTSMAVMFNGCTSLTSIGSIENWNTSRVTDMNAMFQNCEYLTQLNVSKWNVSNVLNTSYMFNCCTSLTSIGSLENWNTSKINNMAFMFNCCKELTNLGDIGSWSTSQVTDMSHMFSECHGLVDLGNLDNWDTSKVTDMKFMFNMYSEKNNDITSNLNNIGNLDNWNTSNVTDMRNMFQCCSKLTNVGDLSRWQTGKVTDTSYMFGDCHSLVDLGNLDNWNTSNVTNMNAMFQCCSKLTSIGDLSNWQTGKVTDMAYMFSKCHSLIDLGNLGNWDTSKVTKMQNMFSMADTDNKNTELINIGDLSNWNTSNVTDMSGMFQYCSKLTSIGDLSNWNTSNVTDMSGMFSGCASLTNIGTLTNWQTGNVTLMKNMFSGTSYVGNGKITKNIDFSKWNVGKVTDMTCMFYGQGATTHYDIENWNVSNCTSFNHMFCDNFALQSLDLSKWDTHNVKTIYNMFDDCRSLTTVGDISHWNTSNMIDLGGLFNGCSSFVADNGHLDLSGWDTSNVWVMGEMFRATQLKSIDLSNFDTSKVTTKQWSGTGSGIYYTTGNYDIDGGHSNYSAMGSMFQSCNKLEEIKLGANWKWYGTNGYLPTPSDIYITGADGKWYSKTTGTAYAPSEIPNNVADTYVAIPPVSTQSDDGLVSSGSGLTMAEMPKAYGTKTEETKFTLVNINKTNKTKDVTSVGRNLDNEVASVGGTYLDHLEDDVDFINIDETVDYSELTQKVRIDDGTTDFAIYMWKDSNNNYFWWSEAETVFLPTDSSELFANKENLLRIDLTGLSSANTTSENNMFTGSEELYKIRVDENFNFVEPNCYFPYGKWRVQGTDTYYMPEEVPSNVSNTYLKYPIVKYKLTLINNGDETVTNNLDGGDVVTLPLNDKTVSGKIFLGWSTSSTATTPTYTDGANFTMPNENVTLYAVWGYQTSLVYYTTFKYAEPWGLKFGFSLVNPTTEAIIDNSKYDNYGMYVYATGKDDTDVPSVSEMLSKGKLYDNNNKNWTKETVKYESADTQFCTLTYDKDIYTQNLANDIYVLTYVTYKGRTFYGTVKNRCVEDSIDSIIANGQVGDTTYNASQVQLATAIKDMYLAESKYYKENGNDVVYPNGTSVTKINYDAVNDSNTVDYSHATSLRAIAPWGLKLQATPQNNVTADTYGCVVYTDNKGKYTTTPSAETLLKDTDAVNYSTADNTATLENVDGKKYITCYSVNGIYTYQLASTNVYTVFYYIKDGKYYYDSVMQRNCMDMAKYGAETFAGEPEGDVYSNMINLYRETYYYKYNKYPTI